MKVPSIRLTDFRAYVDTEILFTEPLSIIRGPNHSGKTTIAQAIQLSLSRRSEGTDPRGAGANDKIRIGGHKAIINTSILGKSGTLELRTTYGPNKTPRDQRITGGTNGTAENFARYLDNNQERLACVLDSDYFVNPKTDQKGILAALVLPSTYAFDPAMRELADRRLGRIDWTANPVAVIDQVYALAYKARTEAKAALGAIHIPGKPVKPQQDAATVQARLAELRAKVAKEAKRKPAGTVQIGRLEQQLTQLNADLSKAENDLEGAQQGWQMINEELIDTRPLEKIAAGRAKYDALEERVMDTAREIQKQKDAQMFYEELADSPFCPTCTQSIPAELVKQKVATHRKLEADALDQQNKLMQEQKALGDITGAVRRIEANKEQLTKRKNIEAEIAALKTKIADLSAQRDAISGQLATARAAEAEPVDTTALDELNTQIDAWEKALVPAVQYQSTLELIEKETNRAAEQRARVMDLEALCAHFGKDGVKAELIAEHIDAFEQEINQVLDVWGYSAKLNMEPYEFLVTNSKGTLPLKELSGSEKLMFSIALQCAIAIHAQIRLVVIDRVDTLINGERGKLFACLKRLLDGGMLDQAIALVSDERSDVPNQSGVGFYRVQDGNVVRL